MIHPSLVLSEAAVLLFVLSGCGPSVTTTTPAQKTVPTPAAVPVFSVPAGWLDFSSDSTRKALMWLVKKDYGAEIIIEKIFDGPRPNGRPEEAEQIEAIARAIFGIDKGKGGQVVQEPEKSESGGRVRWWYVIQNHAGDQLRVVVGEMAQYGLVRVAASIRQTGDLHDAARVQDALLEGPPQ